MSFLESFVKHLRVKNIEGSSQKRSLAGRGVRLIHHDFAFPPGTRTPVTILQATTSNETPRA